MEKKFRTNRRVSVSVQKKCNIGNYESMQFTASLLESIPESEDYNLAFDRLFDEVLNQIKIIESDVIPQIGNGNSHE